MKTFWLESQEKYSGEQLKPLNNYLSHGVLGDSIVAWQGACDVPLEHMIDGEDLRDSSAIQAEQMLHFVLELFQFPLHGAIALQRLMGELLIKEIKHQNSNVEDLVRKGDDIYWGEGKLNISIATLSSNSSLIHFGVNVTNEGTPVKTASLADFQIADSAEFAKNFMNSVAQEYSQIQRAFVKVRTF